MKRNNILSNLMDYIKGISFYLKDLPSLLKDSDTKDGKGGEDSGKEYKFFIGFLEHIPEKDKVFLRITEIQHRDAEGRPLYVEQEEWINSVLKIKKIKATDYWFSHWQFDTEEEAEKFVKLLREYNAYEK